MDWKDIYTLPLTTVYDASWKTSQYKLLYRIIPTNKYIYRCKIKESNLCDFCHCNIETIEHLFWVFATVPNLWNQLVNFIRTKVTSFTLKKHIVIFGILPHTIQNSWLNYLFILMQYFIFNMKCRGIRPLYSTFKHVLKIKLEIDKEIALANDTLNSNNLKWINFFNE